MNWPYWTAGANAALILLASLLTCVWPPQGTDRRTVRLLAGFLMGFAASILVSNTGQLLFSYGYAHSFTPFAFAADVAGLLGAAALLAFTLWPARSPFEGRRNGLLTLLAGSIALALAGLDTVSGFESTSLDLYRVILPLGCALVFLRWLTTANTNGTPTRPLALLCCAFLGYAIFQGTDLLAYFDSGQSGFAPATTILGVLFCATYTSLAIWLGGVSRKGTARPIPLMWLSVAVLLGGASSIALLTLPKDWESDAVLAGITRLGLAVFVHAALRIRVPSSTRPTASASGQAGGA